MAAKDYVWGIKGPQRVGNKYKLTVLQLKQIIKEEIEALLSEKKIKIKKVKKSKKDDIEEWMTDDEGAMFMFSDIGPPTGTGGPQGSGA